LPSRTDNDQTPVLWRTVAQTWSENVRPVAVIEHAADPKQSYGGRDFTAAYFRDRGSSFK